ncbi:MAG: hypothetical protein ABL958_02745 [Bdellovibrionia bacterium]
MKKLGNQLKGMWRDESAQGATEYILLLVAIVALVMLFRKQLLGDNGSGGLVSNMMDRLSAAVQGALQ